MAEKKSPLKEGFLVRYASSYKDIPSQEVELPINVTKAVDLIQQLGFLKEGEAYLSIAQERSKRPTLEPNFLYSFCFGESVLFRMNVFARQIVNIDFQREVFTAQDFVTKLFSEAKKGFQEVGVLNKRTLGRFSLIRMSYSGNKYTGGDIAKLAMTEVATETLIGMVNQELPMEAILDMEELPDSWLQSMLDKFA